MEEKNVEWHYWNILLVYPDMNVNRHKIESDKNPSESV